MKLDSVYLRFPSSLPNDLEGFLVYYPNKFPGIVSYYEEIAPKIADDPEAFRQYGDWAQKELFAGFEKVKADYEAGDKEDLAFLVSIDQRFHKLICYRFWIVNYLFPDGPVHDYYVDKLKALIRKFVDIGDNDEEYEERIASAQRDLMQTDYADLYLQQALNGVEVAKRLGQNEKTADIARRGSKSLEDEEEESVRHAIWDELFELINDKGSSEFDDIRKLLVITMEQVKWRKTRLPFYNVMDGVIEFREQNELLLTRYEQMKARIKELFDDAKQKLDEEEYRLFDIAYQQSRNFIIYKDVMGDIDPVLLPLWFGIHDKMKEILKKTTKIVPIPTGHSGVFYHIVWHLPDDLKAKVMTPDYEPFDLETL